MGLSATLMQLRLSSQTLQKNFGSSWLTGKNERISSMRFKKGSTSRIATDNAMYSASVVLKAISVCNLLPQNIGQPAYEMTKPVRDKTDSGLVVSPLLNPPAKSASTWHSRPFVVSGRKMIPLSIVPSRYLHILLIALSWDSFGLLLNLAH